MSWFRIAAALVIGLLCLDPAAAVCPFCSMQGQTLTKEVEQASFVLFGDLTNPKLNLADPNGGGTTDLVIEDVVKAHDFVKDKKVVVLPRYIPVDKNNPVKFVVFCDFFKDKVDPYRGMPVKDKDVVNYLKGALTVRDRDVGERLEFFFHYLDNPDVEVSTDAYKEFANADNKDVARMIEKGDKAKIKAKLIQWLNDKETPTYRYGLYGYILGMVGGAKDAEVLVQLLNDPQRGLVSGIDGVLAGYICLQKKPGLDYLVKLLEDPKTDFTRRYAGLRTLRFFWEYRPDVLSHAEVLELMNKLLDQSDIADLAIEDLRKWQQWKPATAILGLHDRETHNVPIIKRSILRYALSCPEPAAKDFVEKQRRLDPEKVKDAEELLKLEPPPAKAGAGQ